MTARKIIISHVYPPIPDRQFDWCAYWAGEEETGHYGYGKTKAEAMADLRRLDKERWEADEPTGAPHALRPEVE